MVRLPIFSVFIIVLEGQADNFVLHLAFPILEARHAHLGFLRVGSMNRLAFVPKGLLSETLRETSGFRPLGPCIAV